MYLECKILSTFAPMKPIAVCLMMILLLTSAVMAQRKMVVVNVESKVPVRDVKVSADNGYAALTTWDGLFSVPDSFIRMDFVHPDFERRYILNSELKGDTIFLIPNINALREVVIYGHRRFDERMRAMFRPSEEQKLLAQLPKSIPAGFNPVAFAAWIYDLTLRKQVEGRKQRKKALKEVRRKEAELEEKWAQLTDSTRNE